MQGSSPEYIVLVVNFFLIIKDHLEVKATGTIQ